MQIFLKHQGLKTWTIVNRENYIPMKIKKEDKGEEIVLKEEDE